MKKLILTSLMIFCVVSIFAQEKRNCLTMENFEYRGKKNPKLKAKMKKIETFTQNKTLENTYSRVDNEIITIPIVIHVIYSNEDENISDAQINSQIDVLNEDFRRFNTDTSTKWPQAADTEIQFALASFDPNGNTTTGITRKFSTITNWGAEDAMKNSSTGGVNPWDTTMYLNIWVCNIGFGSLGYAQFPGGNAATDGVVVSPQFFGSSDKGTDFYLRGIPFDKGRTTTHEVGHYLNLRHIWGDGAGDCSIDDFVDDTPFTAWEHYGCNPTYTSCNSLDMVENYMDYTDDGCMNLFTLGQKNRMRAVLEEGGIRRSLALSAPFTLSQPTCSDSIQNGYETGIDCGGPSCNECEITCEKEGEYSISITFDDYPEETSWFLFTEGTIIASASYSELNEGGSSINESFSLTPGNYEFVITDVYGDGICCSYGNGSYTLSGPDGIIASGAEFGSSKTSKFCVDSKKSSNNNLALNGTAKQSSTAHGGVANNAIDGETNGDWSSSSVTHTTVGNGEWWSVVLNATYAIGEIIIYNRTDSCCMERLDDITITIEDANETILWSKNLTSSSATTLSLNTGGVLGSVIKITQNQNDALSLAEVEVYKYTNTIFPDTSKKYYIDSAYFNYRIAATGESEDPYTTSTTFTGKDVEWVFIENGSGYWHIQRAAGGSKPRLRSDNSEFADMQGTSSSGSQTYYELTEGYTEGSYFLTLPDGPTNHKRLQVNIDGDVKMVSDLNSQSWESFAFTEVAEPSSKTNLDDIIIYINQITDVLNIRTGESSNITKIEIYDLSGHIYKSEALTKSETALNIENLTTGLYIVHFYKESSLVGIKRIIKN